MRKNVATAALVLTLALGTAWVASMAHSTRSIAIEVRDLLQKFPKPNLKSPMSTKVIARVKFTRNGGDNASIELRFEGPSYEAVRDEVNATVASLTAEWGSAPTVEWLSP